MRIPRIYHSGQLASGEPITLCESASNHLLRVLRMKVGAEVILFNGLGGEFHSTLQQMQRRSAVVKVGAYSARGAESPLSIELAQGISRGERMDYTLQKAVELGVTAISPILSERSVVRLDSARKQKRLQHWQGVVISACEQCGRNSLPQLNPIQTLDDYLRQPHGGGIILDHRAEGRLDSLHGKEFTLLVGPEGGLAVNERNRAIEAGFQAVQLGPRILRTETAALTTIAALQSRLGDL